MFFWNFEEFQKYPSFFFEFDPKTLKKTKVFLEFHNKFQKNLGFFKLFYQNSEKT